MKAAVKSCTQKKEVAKSCIIIFLEPA